MARTNFRFLLVWRLRNQNELKALLEELSAIHPVSVLHEMYEMAISDEDYSFFYVNLVAKQKNDMFYTRFDSKLILDQ